MAQRNGKLIAKKVSDVKSNTLLPMIKERVLQSSIIYTDELPSYNKVSGMGYDHKRVHHQAKIFVIDDADTNTIEGF